MFSLRGAPHVTDIRSYGMFAAFDVESDGVPGRRGHVLQKKLFDNGLNLKTTGDCALIAPPLIAEKAAYRCRSPTSCARRCRHFSVMRGLQSGTH